MAHEELPFNDRYGITCGFCHSLTWFDTDEEPALMTPCWRCGAIINGDL